MAQFASDTFTAADGTTVQAYSANWTKHTLGSSIDSKIYTNRAAAGSSGTSLYYHSGTPESADYVVSADIKFKETNGGNGFSGVVGRCNSSAVTFYMARYAGGTDDAWQLYRCVGGSFTSLGSYAATYADEAAVALVLSMSGSSTTSLSVTIGGVERITYDDNTTPITAAGKAGFRIVAAGSITGMHIDNFSADDIVGGAIDLIIADATHAHSADNLGLTTLAVLVVAESLHSHLADNVVLSLAGTENLVIADAAHAHNADNLSLTSQLALSIAEAVHAHTADGIVITSEHVLAVADALHAHLADNIDLSDAPSLTVADSTHAHTADALGLTTDSLLAIADAVHAHLADNVSLNYAATLAILDSMHAHFADNVVLNFADLLGRAHVFATIAAERRTLAIPRDSRIKPRPIT